MENWLVQKPLPSPLTTKWIYFPTPAISLNACLFFSRDGTGDWAQVLHVLHSAQPLNYIFSPFNFILRQSFAELPSYGPLCSSLPIAVITAVCVRIPGLVVTFEEQKFFILMKLKFIFSCFLNSFKEIFAVAANSLSVFACKSHTILARCGGACM